MPKFPLSPDHGGQDYTAFNLNFLGENGGKEKCLENTLPSDFLIKIQER